MATTKTKNPEPTNALYRVKRGLSAYVSYLAACEMNQGSGSQGQTELPRVSRTVN